MLQFGYTRQMLPPALSSQSCNAVTSGSKSPRSCPDTWLEGIAIVDVLDQSPTWSQERLLEGLQTQALSEVSPRAGFTEMVHGYKPAAEEALSHTGG